MKFQHPENAVLEILAGERLTVEKRFRLCFKFVVEGGPTIIGGLPGRKMQAERILVVKQYVNTERYILTKAATGHNLSASDY
jgi:hypothetical protein